jgi:serine/threonine-protein kinase
VFALGSVLYEATTGRPPFVGESEPQLLAAVARGEFPMPSELVASYPDELKAIVMRAMARAPIARFPTAERMRMALEEWLARSGPIVTQTQVAVVVQQRIGAVIERRRDKIRAASQGVRSDGDTTPAPPMSGSSSGVQPAPNSSLSLSHYSEPPPLSQSSSGVQPAPNPRYEQAPTSGAPGSSPPGSPPASSPPGSSHPSRPAPSSPDASSYLLAVGIGVGIALVLGVAGFIALGLSQRHPAPRPAPAIVAPSAASTSTGP